MHLFTGTPKVKASHHRPPKVMHQRCNGVKVMHHIAFYCIFDAKAKATVLQKCQLKKLFFIYGGYNLTG